MMNTFSGIVVSGLSGLVPLVAEWIGLFVMRGERTGAWWSMIGGATIQTLGRLGAAVAMILMLKVAGPSRISSNAWASYSSVAGFASLAATGGSLVFTVGFAIHCLTHRAAREREQQLEAMTAAMAEELRVLRERVE